MADGSGSAVTIIPIDPIDHKTKLHNDSEEAARRAGQGRARGCSLSETLINLAKLHELRREARR